MWELCNAGQMDGASPEKVPTVAEIDDIIVHAQKTGAITRRQAATLEKYYKGFFLIPIVKKQSLQNLNNAHYKS